AVSSFFHCTAGAKKLFGAAGRTSRDVGSKKKDSPSACNKNLQARSNTGKNYDCFSLRGFAARGRSRSARGEHGLADLLAAGVVGVRRARGHGGHGGDRRGSAVSGVRVGGGRIRRCGEQRPVHRGRVGALTGGGGGVGTSGLRKSLICRGAGNGC